MNQVNENPSAATSGTANRNSGGTPSKTIEKLKERGFFQQCTDEETLGTLLDTKEISCYVGLDPTGPSLHIGHIIPLYAMVHLAKAGHRAVALIGSGTARVGDPSGKTEMRKILSSEQIESNAIAMKSQVERFFKVLGVADKITILDNWQWLGGLNYIEFLRDIGKHFSVNRMLSFETYKQKLEHGLSFIEFNYQLLQSYDFLQLLRLQECTLQIGGDDQWGNIVAGIDLIRRIEGKEAYGLTFPLVTRADGKKMGKSEKGAIFLDPELCSPYDFYQYWRNIPDADVKKMLSLYTFFPMDEVEELGSRQDQAINESKEKLAFEVTRLIHGEEEAKKALQAAKSAFGTAAKQDLSNLPTITIERNELEEGIGILDLYARTDLCSSRGEARRLVTQGGARVNDVQITDYEAQITLEHLTDDGIILKAGKKRYFRIEVK